MTKAMLKSMKTLQRHRQIRSQKIRREQTTKINQKQCKSTRELYKTQGKQWESDVAARRNLQLHVGEEGEGPPPIARRIVLAMGGWVR